MYQPVQPRSSVGATGLATAEVFDRNPNSPLLNDSATDMGGEFIIERPLSEDAHDNIVPNGHPDADDMTTWAESPPVLSFVSLEETVPTLVEIPAIATFADNDPATLDEEIRSFASALQESIELEAAELDELLDVSVPDGVEPLEKESGDPVNFADSFDDGEMSILHSFLVDASAEKSLKAATSLDSNYGTLDFNTFANMPIESVMALLEEDMTDDDVEMAPPASITDDVAVTRTKNAVLEAKSRRLCRVYGCYKRTRSNGLCISHGGGRRCLVDGCGKSSQGGDLCIRHGGGKRCSVEGCEKAAQSDFLCKFHGGGPRCQFRGCVRSSQGGGYCRAHGGGKRCLVDGCSKGTQSGDYCGIHGGTRQCKIVGCTRSDRGGGMCSTHGGGRRCAVSDCTKPCRVKGLCAAHLRQAGYK